jgi:hypothetical protein
MASIKVVISKMECGTVIRDVMSIIDTLVYNRLDYR